MGNEKLINTFTKGRLRLLRMARSLLSPDDAEDALQEAFCRLWPRAETLLTEADADKVAMATVRNVSIDQLRKRHLSPALSQGEGDVDTNESDRFDNRSQLELVEEIVERELSPQQQRIFRMHDIEGYTYEEIAHKEQMLEAAVRKQLSRARKIIRECYKKGSSSI